jgi:uncharacterized integral membrane protein
MWLLKAAIFFTLFAFALNNQQIVAVNFFFGTFWKANLVLVVLTAFSIGLLLGVLLTMPRWWKYRKNQVPLFRTQPVAMPVKSSSGPDSAAADKLTLARDGL